MRLIFYKIKNWSHAACAITEKIGCSPKPPKKLVALHRRYERVYKRVAAASVTFLG